MFSGPLIILAFFGDSIASAVYPYCLSPSPGDLTPIDIEYDANQGRYYTSFGFGSSDNIPAVVDTGSSTWWVAASYFRPSHSINSKNQTTELLYTSSSLSAELYTGPISLGSYVVEDFTFGVVASGNSMPAILGLGLPGGESTVSPSSYTNGKLQTGYTDTFVTQLKNSGKISTAAYSLWLNDQNIGRGQLLFGGIDTAKFSGTLGRIHIVKTPELDSATRESYHPSEPWQFAINLNSVSLENGAGESALVISGAHLPVLLDSGSTYSLVSPKFVGAIVESLSSSNTPLSYDPQYNMFTTTSVPKGNFIFDFSGVTISCPFSDFFAEAGTANGVTTSALTLTVSTATTDINSAESITILGQNFLSSAYVVFDEEHTEVALGQAKRGQLFGSSEILEIKGNIPSATKAPRYEETQVSGEYEVYHAQGLFD